MNGKIWLLRSIENDEVVVGQRRFSSVGSKGWRFEKVKPFKKFKNGC